MATKTNIRSIRFSDELAELISQQTGGTFTEKFENLVTRCVWELPVKEQQLKRLEEMTQQEMERCQLLRKQCGNYSQMLHIIGEKLMQVQKQDELTEET